MPTEPLPAPALPLAHADYWSVPEIAFTLRLVTQINVGAMLALCMWFTMQVMGGTGLQSLFWHGAARPPSVCRCEMQLTPLPPGHRQWACAQAGCAKYPRG